ncbi:MAG: Rne/Rng family ribonuclease [Bacteroidales bacterium]|nr:Rne/Rng family ribonuclease [Bacteroidales bacterium]
MDKELIISSGESEVCIALLEDKQLVELHKEKKSTRSVVGDVYVGRVRKIMPGLNAAFIDIGEEKEGFVHYLDLGVDYLSFAKYLKQAMGGDRNMVTLKGFKNEPAVDKNGTVSNLLTVGQYVLAQVSKEPISTKGAKLSGEVSLAGHYLVLVPFTDKVMISQKIRSVEERKRLRRLMTSIRPDGFGLIVRTVSEGRSVAELDADLRILLSRWEEMTERLRKLTGPAKVLSELSATSALVRDVLSDDFNTIYVDDEQMYNEIRGYVQMIAPNKADIVKHYKMETPIFEQFGVQRDIRRAFGRIVTIRSGVYLYVEHTEAMHVIDVNSGNHIKSGDGQEDTALQVNIESAKEIARQLRLRDMGGIVIVDFVDMRTAEHRKQLYDVMCEEMRKDKARHTILPLSKFGLMQITRQRVRPVVEVDVSEKCPFCDGTGVIKQSLVVVDEIESNLRYLVTAQNERKVTIVVHPYVEAYLTKGLFSQVWRWRRKFKMRIKIVPSESTALTEHRFLNTQGEEIKL